MPIKKTIILSIDGLSTRDLGPYGNTWIETPSFDRLASRALLFENVLTNSTDPQQTLASMLTGIDAGGRHDPPRSVLESIRGQQISTMLFSDAEHPFPASIAASSFDRSMKINLNVASHAAADWEQTNCASFFAQLIEALAHLPSEYFLWAHYSGLSQCWDAPFEWRQRMVDEDDPDPPTWVSPPRAVWHDRDPDEQLRHYQALAAEIQVLDACLGILFNEVSVDSNMRFGLVSPRGYPLGEHGIVGLDEHVLYSESTAVPLMLADFAMPIGWRSQNLVQPTVVAEVLNNWLATDVGVANQFDKLRIWGNGDQPVMCASDRGCAVRTSDWMLVQVSPRCELYAKPDDRWEFNDVSIRCPEVVQELLAWADQESTTSNRNG